MKHIDDERQLFSTLFDMLEKHFGDSLEVVLHDLSFDKAHSVLDIRNGEITHRTIGSGALRHGLEVIPGVSVNGNTFAEIVYTDDGRILKGSTISIKNDEGEPIGMICINEDITRLVEFGNYIERVYGTDKEISGEFAKDINGLLDGLIQDALISCGKSYSAMTKKDKLAFLKYLDDRGFFLISKSGPKICEILHISKFTLYKYLEIIRSNKGEK
jgi:predicted transcriptional regulator YheO